ncbi:hypothetical protein OUZ56_033733 [Daphnia magna]|uniref:Uncharacterized protein n=1 Tax=Daphnia magna TaxID=35525 RepID=A0ABR0BB09_9CRUS|nr:hypothetical protein OUZ56_033733 [Daphnia magna]
MQTCSFYVVIVGRLKNPNGIRGEADCYPIVDDKSGNKKTKNQMVAEGITCGTELNNHSNKPGTKQENENNFCGCLL